MDMIATVLTSVGVSGVTVVALGAFLGQIWKKRLEIQEKAYLDLLSEIDLSIQKQRIDAYQEAWSYTGILSLWPRRTTNFQELRELSKKLRDWYFNTGGIYLSDETRSGAYESLQKALCSIDDSDQGDLNEEEYVRFQSLCSALRTSMTDDILSRRKLFSKSNH